MPRLEHGHDSASIRRRFASGPPVSYLRDWVLLTDWRAGRQGSCRKSVVAGYGSTTLDHWRTSLDTDQRLCSQIGSAFSKAALKPCRIRSLRWCPALA
jgi:hypothetical protein